MSNIENKGEQIDTSRLFVQFNKPGFNKFFNG